MITMTIRSTERSIVTMGPTFMPVLSSWKNRMRPAPPMGIGPSDPRRRARFDFFFDKQVSPVNYCTTERED
jgi:hypothetical protein